MRLKPIFCFFLCLGFHLSQGETTSPSLAILLITLIPASDPTNDQSRSHEPRSVSQSELDPSEAVYELQKLSNFTDGLEALLEIYDSPDYDNISANDNYDPNQIIGKNFKKAMDASRKCGIILYEGLKYMELRNYYDNKHEENEEIFKYQNVSDKLGGVLRDNIRSAAEFAFYAYQKNAYSSSFEDVKNTFKQTCRSLSEMLWQYFNARLPGVFKEECSPSWNDIAFINYLEIAESDLKSENYIDAVFISCHKFYKLVLEFDMASYPMCRIFKEGIPSNQEASTQATRFLENLQRVNKKFKELNYKRQEYYWTTENIVRIVKTYILGENMTDFSGDNYKIANNIHKDLDENYKSLGYIYHVSVSDKTGRNGYNDTLLQCLTECKYIYNINGKDVYIIRNKRECKFLPKSDLPYCGNDRDPRDLQELAKQIQANCNPAAFSLIRSARENRYSNYYPEKNQTPAFTQKCFGDISLTMANNY